MMPRRRNVLLRRALFAVALVLVGASVIGVLMPFTQFPRLSNLTWDSPVKLQDYGTWLSGVLTPSLLAVAMISFFYQKLGQDESNTIQTQAFLLANIHEIYGHLNYLAYCTRNVERPNRPDQVKKGDLQEVVDLNSILESRNTSLPGILYDSIIGSLYFHDLFHQLSGTIDIVKAAQFSFYFDRRLIELHKHMAAIIYPSNR